MFTLAFGVSAFLSLEASNRKWNRAEIALETIVKTESAEVTKKKFAVPLKNKDDFFVVDDDVAGSTSIRVAGEKVVQITDSDLSDKLGEMRLKATKKSEMRKDYRHFFVYNAETDKSFLVSSMVVHNNPFRDELHLFNGKNVFFVNDYGILSKIDCETGKTDSAFPELFYKFFIALGFFLVPLSIGVFKLLSSDKPSSEKDSFSRYIGQHLSAGVATLAASSLFFYFARNSCAVSPDFAADTALKFSLIYSGLSASLSAVKSKIKAKGDTLKALSIPFKIKQSSEKLEASLEKVGYKEENKAGLLIPSYFKEKKYDKLLSALHTYMKTETNFNFLSNLFLKSLAKVYPLKTLLTKDSVKKDDINFVTGFANLDFKNSGNAFDYFSRLKTVDYLALALEVSSMSSALSEDINKILKKYILSTKDNFKSFGHHPVFEVPYDVSSLANFCHVIKKGSEKDLIEEFNRLKEFADLIESENLPEVYSLVPIYVGKFHNDFYLVERRIHGDLLNHTENISAYNVAAQILALSHAKSSLTGVEKDYLHYVERFKSKFPDISSFNNLLESFYKQSFVFDEDGHDLNFIVGKSENDDSVVTKIDRASRPDVAYGVDLGRLFMRNLEARDDAVEAYSDAAGIYDFHVENVLKNSAFGQVFAALSYAFYEVEQDKEHAGELLTNASEVVKDYDKPLSKQLVLASRNL